MTRISITQIIRKTLGLGLIFFGIGCFYMMDQATLVLNASKSLPDNAFLIFDAPARIRRGSIVAFDMPPLLKDRFKEKLFVKVVAGLPGDVIGRNAVGDPCINGTCYPLQEKNGRLIGAAIPEGRIPPGHYAVFGAAANSLDSRYDMIGLMSAQRLRGTGFAIPFPHWEEVATWF